MSSVKCKLNWKIKRNKRNKKQIMNTNRVAEIKHQFWLWTSLVLLFIKKASQFLSKIKMILELNLSTCLLHNKVIKWHNRQWSFSKLRKKNSWTLLHKVFHLHLPGSIHILLSAHQWHSAISLILSLLIHSESGPASPESSLTSHLHTN